MPFRGGSSAFQVACTCGGIVRGERQSTHQMVPCKLCGRSAFVFPASPWPSRHKETLSLRAAPAVVVNRRPALVLVGIAAVPMLLALLLIGGLVVWMWATLSAAKQTALPAGQPKDRLEAGRQALAQGYFWVALDEAQAGERLADSDLTVSARDARALRQLRQEAGLFTDLLDQTPEVLLDQAPTNDPTAERDWQSRFAQRLAGRALIFDGKVARQGDRLTLDNPVQVRNRKAWVELSNLTAFQQLQRMGVDFTQPRRVVFGARLASLRLEPPGEAWAFRFAPESGVLLTNRAAVAKLRGDDPSWAEVLDAQAAWTYDLR